MDVHNEMEALVREAVQEIRAKGTTGDTCWCRLCETDIVALALTLLPPFYSRPGGQAWSAGLATASKIHDAVQSAAKRVSLRPKHRPGMVGPARGDVGLVNYTYEVGLQMVDPSVLASSAACTCPLCRADTLAYALNRYPPKYGVSAGGRRSLHPTYLGFMRRELGLLVSQAARVVGAKPQHRAHLPSAG